MSGIHRFYKDFNGDEAFLIGNVSGLSDGMLSSILPKYGAVYTDVFKADPSDICEKVKERLRLYLLVQDYTDVHAVDRMSFELTRTEDDLMQAIAKALGKELSSSDSETIGSLSRFLRIRLGDIKGIYKISGELSEKVTDAINAFYAYVVFVILFIEFEGYMVMIVFGSDE